MAEFKSIESRLFKFISIGIGGAFVLYAEMLSLWPRSLIVSTILFLAIYSWCCFSFLPKVKGINRSLLFQPTLFLGSSILFLWFLEIPAIRQLTIFLLGFLIFRLFLSLFSFKEDLSYLFQLFRLASTFTIFTGYIVFYKMFILFDVLVLSLVALGFLLTFFSTHSLLAYLKKGSLMLPYSLVISFLMLQWSWILFFFPTSFYVNAAILAISYAFSLELIFSFLREETFEKKKVFIFSGVSIFCIALILFSASWF